MNPEAAKNASMKPLAEARMAAYRFLLAALDKPSPEQHAWLAGRSFRRALEGLCGRFGVEPPPEGAMRAGDAGDHESRYIACFEVGMPKPPVVLAASHYNRREPAPKVIHEHRLFYRRFGARPARGNIEQADHLLNELAFLIHLDVLLVDGRVETASILRGRRDFLERHAARWPGRAAVDAEANDSVPRVYAALLAVLAAAVEQDLEITESLCASRS